LEFEAAADHSPEKYSEAMDVLGLLLLFQISPSDLKDELVIRKKEYILTKIKMLLQRTPDRKKYYDEFNASQKSRGRRPFNPVDLERVFTSL
jgi:hypothetical protein